MTGDFDVVILGGGSAGAVLANRLSEDGTRRVRLLEAAEAYRPNLYPPDLANADVTGGLDGHDRGYTGAPGLASPSIRALRGKVLGGSSAVNAAVAIRARAADFAKWTRRGIDRWTFDDVLPRSRPSRIPRRRRSLPRPNRSAAGARPAARRAHPVAQRACSMSWAKRTACVCQSWWAAIDQPPDHIG